MCILHVIKSGRFETFLEGFELTTEEGKHFYVEVNPDNIDFLRIFGPKDQLIEMALQYELYMYVAKEAEKIFKISQESLEGPLSRGTKYQQRFARAFERTLSCDR